MTEAAMGALEAGGTSVDACIAGLLAAAGVKPGVLLGSMTLLVSGTGAGTHLFDGSVVQPGIGAPRPRGFVRDSDVPIGARVAISASAAMLTAAHTHDGRLSMSTLVSHGVRAAKDSGAVGRAGLLSRVAQMGALAFREESFSSAMLDVAGRMEGGNATQEDLAEVQAVVSEPSAVGRVVYVGAPRWDSDIPPIEVPPLECVVVVASDRRGVVAAAHCAFDAGGPTIEPFEVTASRLAVPVRRGVRRVVPSTLIQLPVPIAILTRNDLPWAVVAMEASKQVDWELVDQRVGAEGTSDLTFEQLIAVALCEGDARRRVLAVMCGTKVDAARSCVIGLDAVVP